MSLIAFIYLDSASIFYRIRIYFKYSFKIIKLGKGGVDRVWCNTYTVSYSC